MKTGLVLEGGGMRGIYTAGVLDVLMKHKIWTDGVIGVSAGACHGAGYVSGQRGRSIRYTAGYSRDWRFMSFRSLLLTGNVVGEKLSYHDIPYELDPFDFEAFFQSPIRMYAGATDLETGKAVYLDLKQDYFETKRECECRGVPFEEKEKQRAEKLFLDMIRASASLPLVSNVVEIKGKKLLDGGTADSIPVREFRRMGYRKNIVVLTRPEGYQKEQDRTIPLMAAKYRRYPEYVKMAARRHIKYNKTLHYIKELEKRDEVFVLRPSVALNVSRMEKDEAMIRSQYQLGIEDTEKRLEKLKQWMEK